jgi:hypothetical protein
LNETPKREPATLDAVLIVDERDNGMLATFTFPMEGVYHCTVSVPADETDKLDKVLRAAGKTFRVMAGKDFTSIGRPEVPGRYTVLVELSPGTRDQLVEEAYELLADPFGVEGSPQYRYCIGDSANLLAPRYIVFVRYPDDTLELDVFVPEEYRQGFIPLWQAFLATAVFNENGVVTQTTTYPDKMGNVVFQTPITPLDTMLGAIARYMAHYAR